MRNWFTFTNAAGEVATLSIFDEIGMWGITAADFQRALKSVTAPVINLEINSPGGSVFDGIAIYNMLRASGKTVNAKVMGVAASIASVILMAADKITMPANSMVMVHAPSGGMFGTADEHREMADVLDKVQASLVGTYMKRTGKSEDDVKAMLSKDTWLTAAEALEAGFADEVIDGVDLTAAFDITDERVPEAARIAFKAAADARAAAATKGEPDVASALQELGEARTLASKLVTGGAPASTANHQEVLDEIDAAISYLNGETPPAKEDDESDEKKNAAKPFGERVTALLAGTGFEAHAAPWAVKFTTADEITAQITVAREIKALFALAKRDDKAAALIARGASLAEARADLLNALAEGDEHIDTSREPGDAEAATAATRSESLRPTNVYARRNAGAKENSAADKKGPSAGSTAAIWANRNK